MDPARRYVDQVAARLVADGCELRTESWNGIGVLVGRRADFKLRWMATRLHLYTIVAAVPEITVAAIEEFTSYATGYAKASPAGQMRGAQTGVALFPGLVGDRVDPAASAWAAEKQRVDFACLTRPVVVDLARNNVACFRGRSVLGWLYAGYLREKGERYFPQRTTVDIARA